MDKLPLVKRLLLNVLLGVAFILRRRLGINWAKPLLHQVHEKFGKGFRFMVSGGAKLDATVAWSFYKWGFTILEGYGLTETSPVATFNAPEDFRIGSVFTMIVFDLDYENLEYGYRFDGPWDPENGHRFDVASVLLDPYARQIGGRNVWVEPPLKNDPYSGPSAPLSDTMKTFHTVSFPGMTQADRK